MEDRTSVRLRKAARWAVGLVVVMAGGMGCASRRAPEVWSQHPQVHWEDLATYPVQPAHDGFVILTQERSRGRFPAAIGVSRVGIEVNATDSAQPREAYLLPRPRNEFLAWNTAFDDQMAVSEVFPIWQRDLGGADAEPAQINAAFRALGARVGLVYAQNHISEDEAEMLGVLYDTNTGAPLASIHAQARSLEGRDEEQVGDDPSLWDTDARARVRAQFVEHTYECLRALVARDDPQVEDIPEGWTPAEPQRLIVWPPRDFNRSAYP